VSAEHILVGVLGVVALAVAFLACLVAIDENDLGNPGWAWGWFAFAVAMFVGGGWLWRAF
jgi:hypothetical protein